MLDMEIGGNMKKEEKKQYQKPEITQHENLSEVTKGNGSGTHDDKV